jgi:hypothetical protein
VRRGLIAAVTILAGCASAGPPPGGPEDRTPPRLVRVTPDTNAVNVHDKVATFYFDKVINDRGTGAQEIPSYFLVSPSDGPPRVNTHRTRIDVRPRHGFRENTAYTITMLPGLTDLRSNAMKTGASVVFSTGPTIPTLRINGVAFDWVAERVAPRALIEAISKDSVVYLAQADTVGNFSVGPLSPGTYLMRATVDQNQNRTLDRGEPWDSVRVVAPQTAPVELLTAPRDTLPPLIQSVAVFDSVTVRLTFDRLLDPAQTFPVANFRVVGSDSAAVPIVAVRTPREEADIAKRAQAAPADSARRADSLAGRAVPPVSTAVPPLPTARNAAAAQAAQAKPSRPAPFTAITLVLARPLPPNANYVARVTTVRALSGRASPSERRFTTPRPRGPSDNATTPSPGSAPPAAPPADPRSTPPAPPATTPPSRP